MWGGGNAMRKEHMTYLREILKMGSITAAANHLNITPQALSSAIKILEQELEFDLLKRSNQGVEFTARRHSIYDDSQ